MNAKKILAALCMISLPAAALAGDDFSFAFFGCNRLDGKAAKAVGSKSTANEIQLSQDFSEIGKLQPDYLILAGDAVLGLEEGTQKLGKEIKHWKSFVAKNDALDPKKTTMIVFTGNHEMLQKIKQNKEKTEIPNPDAYPFWQQKMADYIAGQDGPKKGEDDALLDNESGLSYTFRHGGNFFMVLNTDSLIDDKTIGDIPLYWIKKKLRDAQHDPKVSNIFVMGHKPILAPGSDEADAAIRADQAEKFYAILGDPGEDGSPSKVRAYLAAHAHEWRYDSALTFAGKKGKIPQIIAGNGGSPPNKNWRGKDAYFGYTLVKVAANGGITAQSYGRDIPSPYYQQQAMPSTARGKPIVLYQP